MSLLRLLLQNLVYHRRANLAILLGVAVGTAVLTGALLVGDSLRGSLRDLTLKQLGWIDSALVADRFIRQHLADELEADHVSPAIILQGTVSREDEQKQPTGRRIPKVLLAGVNASFWTGSGDSDAGQELAGGDAAYWNGSPEQVVDYKKRSVVLSAALADDLGVTVGDRVHFTLEKASTAPRESVLGRRQTKDVVASLSLVVQAVLPPDHFGSRFTLNPAPTLPRNAYLPLAVLQEELRFGQELKDSFENEQPINAIFVRGANPEQLQTQIKEHMDLLDWGLRFRKPSRTFGKPPPYESLESTSLFIPPAVQNAVQKAGVDYASTMVYLVNNITTVQQQVATACAVLAPPGYEWTRPAIAYYGPLKVPYCVVAGVEPDRKPPFGPFLPKGIGQLKDDEIVLVDYASSPLKDVKPGTPVTLTYFQPGSDADLKEITNVFRVAGHLPLVGPADDPYLTPSFPGITDKRTLASWDPPFPFDKGRIHHIDEMFWQNHKTTPKGYITLQAAQQLWGSRYGNITSLRIEPEKEESKENLARKILNNLDPKEGGLTFEPVRASSLQASVSGTDFGVLFLAFSFFLIVAALLLVGLLFRLSIDRRAPEVGLLFAVGHERRTVRWLLIAEGGILAVLGAALGSVVAVWYAGRLLDFLAANWPGGLDRSFLALHVTARSIVIGFVAAVLMSVLTIYWTTRLLSSVSPSALLMGETVQARAEVTHRRPRWSLWTLVVGVVGGAICFFLGFQTRDHEMQAIGFFLSGMLLLAAGLAAAWILLRRRKEQPVKEGSLLGLARLGIRNSGRHPVRSLLTMGLLAFATFVVMAVQAFHRDPGADFLEYHGGSGGFNLLAESELPLYQDLGERAFWVELDAHREQSDSKKLLPASYARSWQELLGDAPVYAFRVRTGDDASCLNLYQPRQPRLFGVAHDLIARGGFHFAASEAVTPEEKENPWLLLEKTHDDGSIPVFGEKNSLTWMLHKGLGDTVEVVNNRGEKVMLRIVGILHDSVFHSELLMSDANFQRQFPQVEGFQFFLIATDADKERAVQDFLEDALAPYGFVVTPSRQRLQQFLAVENTYLSTFQALGGLGLLLGALGLAVVLLRGVWERRGELALMRALGFQRSSLGWLVLAENSFLLMLGLLIGTMAACISVAPHLAGGSEVHWLQLTGFLLLVLVTGFGAGLLAVVSTLRAPLIAALRKE